MRLLQCLLLVTVLLSGCSSESGSNDSEPVTKTIAGPFPKNVTGTVAHWESAGDGKGTTMVFLKEYDGTMLILPADPNNPGRVEQAGTKVSFEVKTASGSQCGSSQMQCLLAR